MVWLWQPFRYVGSEQVQRMIWIWIVIPGGPKDQVTWEMKVECCQGQLLFYLSSFWWQIAIHPFEVEHSFYRQQKMPWDNSCHDCWLMSQSDCDMLSLLTLTYWFMKMLAFLVMKMLDLILVMVQLLWDIASLGELASGLPFRPWMNQHCILKKIFPTFCLGLVGNLLGFMTGIDPLLSILMYCPTETRQCWFTIVESAKV